jgi:hypothetical protein
LDREEAIKVLKGMIATHNGNINYVELVPPNETNNALSVGYQLHIKGNTFHSIKDLEVRVTKYGLAVMEDKDKVIIYKPIRSNTC